MRRRVRVALAWGLLLCAPRARAEMGLENRLEAALSQPALRGARVAALVVAREGDRLLYAHHPDRALVPASNLKILTAIAALAAFGPAHRFVTEVFADAPPDTEGAVGVLAVRGGGDPALTSEELWRLAADLRRSGIRQVRGGLLLDDSAFDRERWHPDWGAVSARAYHAPVGALSVNYGAFAVGIRPGARPGDPVGVVLDPPLGLFRVTNRAVTGAARSRSSLGVDRGPEGEFESVAVSGSVPAGGAVETVYRSVRDPAAYAGAVLRMQLEANDISVRGGTRIGPVPEEAVPVLAFEGRSVAEIVRLALKFSNNAIAEGLVKLMGARATGGPGAWPSGVAAMRAELAAIGLATGGLRLADGSGLSYANRVSPRTLVEALRLAADSFRFGPEFVAALPIAAVDGTLEKRAGGAAHQIRAKTGLLTRVTALSGYARLADGSEAVFSVLVNGYRGSDEEAMGAVDAFVAELVGAAATVAAYESSRVASP